MRMSVLTDLDVNFMIPDPSLFPNVPNGVQVHSGFAIEHKKTALKILAEVKRLMAEHSATNVILVRLHPNFYSPVESPGLIGLYADVLKTGHSLGGALAELDTLFMKLNLPAGTIVRGITFGTPRVGNAAWATFFDSQISEFTRMNNKRDPVPIVPGRLLGFRHPGVEIHIAPDGNAVACPGE